MSSAEASTSCFREKEFWILILSGIFLFHAPLFLGETFYFRDLHFHFYPQKLRFVELVRSGQVPLWDPYLHGGQPFLADLNNMAIYPTNLLYLFLPPLITFNLDIVCHILLCAVAAYSVARSLGLTPFSALVAGAVYGFCGYTLSLANLMNRLAAMPYLPLLLLTLHKYFDERKTRWLVSSVILGAFQILAGAPEMTLLTWITIFVFTWAKGRPANVVICFCVLLFVAGISAIQLVPAIEMIQQSTRAAGSNYATFSAWSLNPRRLPELIFPAFLGYTTSTTRQAYWGSGLESMGYPFILSIYCSVLPLLFAAFGIARNRWNKALAALGMLSVVLSIGRYLPGFETLFNLFHSFAAARYPIKFLAVSVLPISLLAASGLDRIFTAETKTTTRAAMSLWITTVFLIAIYLLLTFSWNIGRLLLTFFFSSSSETSYQGVKYSFAYAACTSFAAACIYQHWILKRRPWNHAALAMIVLFDLIGAGFSVNHYAPSEFFKEEPQLAKIVRKEIGQGRLYRTYNPPKMTLRMPANDWLYLYRWNLETLQSYSGALYDIPVIYHEDFDDLAKREIVTLSDLVAKAPWDRRVSLLTSGGVSLLISAEMIQVPGLQLLARIANSSDKPFYLYRNYAISDLAFSVPEVVVVPTPEGVIRRMFETNFDPRRVLILQSGQPLKTECNGAELKLVERKANQWKYLTQSDCDSYVYFAQTFYKGWDTEIDGQKMPSLQANYAFAASPLPKGKHTLERFYRPASFRIGLAITILSIFVLFFCRQGAKIAKNYIKF